MPKVSILLITYSKDAEWAEFCLRSIAKFSSGFHGVVVLCPESDKTKFLPVTRANSRNDLPVVLKTYIPKQGYEFNHHQVMKCYADILCPDSDMVLHVDSDCIFTEAFSPDDYMVGGFPILPVRTYKPSEPFIVWKPITEKALGMVCNYETMARHPALHYSGMYGALRSYMSRIHGIPFSEWVLMQPGNYPAVHFSEFNAMGSFVVSNRYEAQKIGQYHIVDLDIPKVKLPPSKLIQGHSWSGVHTKRIEYTKILNGKNRQI